MTAQARTHNLRLTSAGEARPWDDLSFMIGFREAGLLAQLNPAAQSVLLYALCYASRRRDAGGEVDLPVSAMSKGSKHGTRYDARSVRRALLELVKAGLLEHVGQSRVDPRVKRYRLNVITPGAISAQAGAILPDHDEDQEPDTHVHDGHQCPGRVTSVSETPDTSVTQSNRKRIRKQSSRADGGDAHQPPGLFDPAPGYDAAAARILRGLGLSAHQASGLVKHHKLTRQDARNFRANLRARKRKTRKGKKQFTIFNPGGLIPKMLREDGTALGGEVLRMLDGRRRDRELRNRRAASAAHVATERQEQQTQAARRARAEAVYRAMSAAEREAVHRELLADQPTDTLLRPSAVHLDRWSIELIMERKEIQPHPNPGG